MEKYNLKIIGKPTEFGNIDFLENHKFKNDKPFPNSYKEFVKKYGYGKTLGQFFIYIPMNDYGDSWNIRTEEIKNTYYDDLIKNNIWFELEPDANMELLRNLVPFACSENGFYLFWNPETENDGEFDIFVTDFNGLGFRRAGKTLYEVLEKMANEKYYKEIFPIFVKEAFPNVFECFKKMDMN
jgi:hypothetical protein